jgi:hypothetical protein
MNKDLEQDIEQDNDEQLSDNENEIKLVKGILTN